MMARLSLKARLSWLVGAALLATLLFDLAILLAHAGPRIRAEADNNLRLTRDLVAMTLASLQESDDPEPALRRFLQGLSGLRHVDVTAYAAGEAAPRAAPARAARKGERAPDWFVALIDGPPKVAVIPVSAKGAPRGEVAIVSNPSDEMAEIWSDASRLALASLGVAAAMLTLALTALRAALKPFDALRAALAALEAGKAQVRIVPRGAAEFRGVAAAVNALAAALDRVKEENRVLLKALVRVQDAERKEIARDLHDEAGPCLFSIRAGATALRGLAASPAPDAARLRDICANVDRASAALQALFRGLLGRLRPGGLAEFGLAAALQALAAGWRQSRPEVALQLVVAPDLAVLDEAAALTAYRVVQEGLTNVYRHAEATWAQARVEWGGASEAPQVAPTLLICVEDDGVGFTARRSFGFGLMGMRERVQALGGMVAIGARPGGGARLLVTLPPPGEDEPSA